MRRKSSNASEVDLGLLLDEIGSFDPESKIYLQRQLSNISSGEITAITEPERPISHHHFTNMLVVY
jgi:hypothetical protein